MISLFTSDVLTITAHYIFDPDFTEQDELWTPDHQEQDPSIARRARTFLDHLFANDSSTYVGVTAHGGLIRGFLRAVGHRQVGVQTGGLIPIVVSHYLRHIIDHILLHRILL